MEIDVKIKLVRAGAALPERATAGAAAYDLRVYPDEPVVLHPGCREKLPTGIAIAPEGDHVAALVLGRSGLGTKHGITLANSVGLIDSDYRGEVSVTLINNGSEAFTVFPGDRVAQLMFVPAYAARLSLCDELPETARGEGGFGSTGV